MSEKVVSSTMSRKLSINVIYYIIVHNFNNEHSMIFSHITIFGHVGAKMVDLT